MSQMTKTFNRISFLIQTHRKKKIVVIGAGVSGLSTAWHLAKTGRYDVTVFERESIGAYTQASSINSGFLHTEPKPEPHKFVHDPNLLKGLRNS